MRDFKDILTINKNKRLDVCKECARNNKLTFVSSLMGLSAHIRTMHHKMTMKTYVIKYHHYGFNPTCQCGCERKVTFHIYKCEFAKYISGHNYIGHTKENDESVKIRSEKTKIKLKGNPLCAWSNHPEIPEEEKKKIRKKIAKAGRKATREGRRKKRSQESIEKGKKTKKENLASGKTKHWTKTKSKEEVYKIMSKGGKKAQKTIQKNIENGKVYKNPAAGFKNGWYFSVKNNKSFWFQSSYEEEKFIEFDNDPIIKSWRHPAGIVLRYYNTEENKKRNYFVDFLVERCDGKKQIIETKGVINQETLDKAKVFFRYAKKNNLEAYIFTKRKNEFVELTLQDIKSILKSYGRKK